MQARLRDKIFVESLTLVRRALDEAAVDSVRGSGGSIMKSPVFKSQVQHIRTGNFAT